MSTYEYRVIPAPTKGTKAKGVKTPEARFARTIEDTINEMAADGWAYQRAETLPSVERSGLTGSTTEWRNLLVFRRPATTDAEDFVPEAIAPPVMATAEAEEVAQEASEALDDVVQDHADAQEDTPAKPDDNP